MQVLDTDRDEPTCQAPFDATLDMVGRAPELPVRVTATGGRAAARLLYYGTLDGPFVGIAATGSRFAYAGAAFFSTERGRLASAWVLGDLASLRDQLRTNA